MKKTEYSTIQDLIELAIEVKELQKIVGNTLDALNSHLEEHDKYNKSGLSQLEKAIKDGAFEPKQESTNTKEEVCTCKNDNSLSGAWCNKCEAPVAPRETVKMKIMDIISNYAGLDTLTESNIADQILTVVKERV